MKSIFAIIAPLFMLTAPAVAQTSLQLSVTGTATALPDQIAASLTVRGSAPTAAAAQAAVNRAAGKALAAATAVAGVAATTGDYSVNSVDPGQGRKPGFQASQELDLTMPAPGRVPPAAFNALLGDLQASGLLLNGLNGGLSAAGQDAAQRAAVTDALHRLQAEGNAVAATLNDQVTSIKSLSVQTGGAVVRPMGRMMMAAAAPPPQAAPGPVTVSADVSAELLLDTRP